MTHQDDDTPGGSPAVEPTEAERICDEAYLRLLSGETAAADPALAVHVGSCLRCFRTAAELRELPRLQGLLRTAELDAAVDPGEAFWRSFPARVADAWEGRPATAAPGGERASGRGGLAAWMRRPFVVPFGGVAAAAAFVLAASHVGVGLGERARFGRETTIRAEAARPRPSAAAAPKPEIVPRDLALLGPPPSDSESLEALGAADLDDLVEALGSELAEPDAEDADDGDEPAIGRPLVEELDLLDASALRRLIRGLPRSI